MALIKKDKKGNVKRIEYRSENVRVSRTGGAALRKQIRVKGGLNISINTAHGARVSKRVAKGTLVGFQNKRFFLKGRYGKGPTKLNLSKTGATVSTQNKFGTYNWVRPNRSSFKFAGIQFRGRKASSLHFFYFLYAATAFIFMIFYKLIYHTVRIALNFAYIVVATPFKFATCLTRVLFRGSSQNNIIELYNISNTNDISGALKGLHYCFSGMSDESYETIESTIDAEEKIAFGNAVSRCKTLNPSDSLLDYVSLSNLYSQSHGSHNLIGLLLDIDDHFLKFCERNELQEKAIISSLEHCEIEVDKMEC